MSIIFNTTPSIGDFIVIVLVAGPPLIAATFTGVWAWRNEIPRWLITFIVFASVLHGAQDIWFKVLHLAMAYWAGRNGVPV